MVHTPDYRSNQDRPSTLRRILMSEQGDKKQPRSRKGMRGGRHPKVHVEQKDLNQSLPALEQTDEDLTWIAAHTVAALQAKLSQLAHTSFGSYENNWKFFVVLRRVLIKLNHVFSCPNCGKPSRLGLSTSASPSGQFRMKHVGRNGKYCWTGTYLPVMRLIPCPDDED